MSTPIPLWMALAIFLAVLALSSVQEWLNDQYEITRVGRFRRRVTRRWYGTRAHVRLCRGVGQAKSNIFRVISWTDEDSPAPWLLAVLHSGTSWRLSEDDTGEPEPFWAPVSDFAPYTVRRLRPHILRTDHYRFPQLFDYRPLRQPSGHLAGARDA